ncbi:MAG: flagellar biosynthesis protein FlhF [Gammaproteobacteria bacterium]|jgi:flagellar biosynthesis protein FlhF
MRIKRTFAATMREALQQVKLEQGADAVILGNKKVPGGVELISAIDFDEQTFSGSSSEKEINMRPPLAEVSQSPKSDVVTDNWSGNLLPDSFGGRTEPILGPVVAPKIPAITSKPVSRQPDWLKQELAAASSINSKNAPISKVKPESQKITQPIVPAKPVRRKKKKLAQIEHPFEPIKQTQSDPRLVIDEVKQELQNLRDLMESQLSVLQWEKFSQHHPVRSVLLNLMSELGLGADICEAVMAHLKDPDKDPHKVWQQALGLIARFMPVAKHDLLAEGGRIALVGSTGVGKTTTIAKLAARFAHTHGKRSVAMISTDQFRIGAQEQLQHFARLLEIPLLMASNRDELVDRLEMLSDKQLVLVDTAGMSQRDLRLSEQFHKLHMGAPEIKPYLVISANTQLAALNQTILSFDKVPLAGAIVTKLDEAASLGGVITVSIRHSLALHYCATGQRVPEDLETAKSFRIISKAVSLMQDYSEASDPQALAARYARIINNRQTK